MDKGEIVLAGGCFWGTEAYLKRLPGIIQTEAGYANSSTPQPSYEEVCSGETGAAEAVRVIYDKDVIPLPLLLEAYLRTIDPTLLNRQGNDRGTQYRTGIYWTDERDEPIVASELRKVERRMGRRVRVWKRVRCKASIQLNRIIRTTWMLILRVIAMSISPMLQISFLNTQRISPSRSKTIQSLQMLCWKQYSTLPRLPSLNRGRPNAPFHIPMTTCLKMASMWMQ